MSTPAEHHDVVVVGAGQAGLALGHHLVRNGVDAVLLDRAERVGTSWRRRWDSLQLFTPVRYDALPGTAFPGSAWSHPGKDDVADYLERYASALSAPVRTGVDVATVEGVPGDFVVRLATGEAIGARRMVVATGPFGQPSVPGFAAELAPQVQQLHSDDYRNPAQLADGAVLVVGGGNSGCQIALELARADREVHLAEGARARHVPQRILGRDLFWWLTATGAVHAGPSSLVGRRLRAGDPVIGTPRSRLRRAGVVFHPRVVGTEADEVGFADGDAVRPAAVVWATGYRHDDRWIDVPGALNDDGELIVTGVGTPVEGLFCLGRQWQRSRGSALLGFVGRDAERLSHQIARSLDVAGD